MLQRVLFGLLSNPLMNMENCLDKMLTNLEVQMMEMERIIRLTLHLWKGAKPTEPAWEAPFGLGRPGWHIECSAMANATFGEQIDIHGGGLDLVFPHHENEVAQSECASSKQYVKYWMHNGLLTMSGGQKMGKSLGNVINIRDALQSYPAEAIRLYLLQNHYRSSLPWSSTALREAFG